MSAKAVFDLSASIVAADGDGKRLRSSASSQSVDTADETLCDSCGRFIPNASLQLHQLGCQRQNFTCEVCGEKTDRRSGEKHRHVRHRIVSCSLGCGETMSADEQAKHRRNECRFRCVPCLYCDMLVPLLERGAHQGECGARSAQCARCSFVTQRKYMRKHIVEEHFVLVDNVSPANDWTPVARD